MTAFVTETLSLRRSFVHVSPAVRVVFGAGSIAQVADEVLLLGTRAAVIGGGPEAVYADVVADALGAHLVLRWAEVVMHVPSDLAARAVDAVRAADVDVLVAVGGGSSIGLAKAVARATHVPIVAVPTTYAGSEMTPIWGETEPGPDGPTKRTGRDEAVRPRTVVYDPSLTLTLPSWVSASSGMNAVAHAVEGLYAPEASPVTALLAEEAVRRLGLALPAVVSRPQELAARAEAQYGTWLAGWTLGTSTMGVHHKVCHVLGGRWDLPHADVHSALISYVAEFNAGAAPQAMAALGRALGVAQADAPGAIWDLASSLGAPTSLSSVGFDPADIAEAAALVAAAPPPNPRPVTADGITTLLERACLGSRP